MSVSLFCPEGASKEEKYQALIPQIQSLIAGEPDLIANLANIAAAFKQAFDFFWIGFYLIQANELVLGPFQGPPACTRIRYAQGVCGTAWKERKIIRVPDVDQFPGHIACNSASRSELVIPLYDQDGAIRGVLDIDSDELDVFDAIDVHYLKFFFDHVDLF
ncbi:MAG: GAF domain-containing protein [Candidatus Azobacteroides sp.]|nr:GAF domain-containing protein [Candidatus Azobacteroides sp.]